MQTRERTDYSTERDDQQQCSDMPRVNGMPTVFFCFPIVGVAVVNDSLVTKANHLIFLYNTDQL